MKKNDFLIYTGMAIDLVVYGGTGFEAEWR
jgi:hypothetical protein